MRKILFCTASAIFLAACGATQRPASTEITADSVLDDQIFQEATLTNNLAKCDEILAAAKKEECKMVVNNFFITSEAVSKLDASLCDDITDKRYQENCQNSVTTKIEQERKYDESLKEIEIKDKERLTIETEALKKGDPEICEGIKDTNQIYSCKYNIIVSKASAQNDPSLCDKIGEETFVQLCRESISNEEN